MGKSVYIILIIAVSYFSSCKKTNFQQISPSVTSNDGIQMRIAMKDNGYIETIVDSIIKQECYFSEWDKTIMTPVSGLFEYHDLEGNWVASINFGDGSCDQWATKTWNIHLFPDDTSGTKNFSVFDIKNKKNK